jgi:hypothetical protein
VDKEIIQNGINGILSSFPNIDKLANSIKKMKLADFDSNKIKNMTAQKYSINSIIKIYEQILNKD